MQSQIKFSHKLQTQDSTKAAWELLHGEHHGGDHVRSVKLQNLIREFEYTRMHDNESLSTYLTRLNGLINQMKTYGELLSNERLVQKVLISLSKVYDPICLVIENTKSVETVELQEVIVILKSQEKRFELHNADATKKVFASFIVSPKGQNKNVVQSGSSKSQKNWNPKGKSWESKEKPQQNNPASNYNFSSSQPENCANQMEVTGNLFYANCATIETKTNGEWYIDSGCSNHMTGNYNKCGWKCANAN
ncbi:unnamed protein product [Prunus armeniaca]